MISLFPEFLPASIIAILPNLNNQVLIPIEPLAGDKLGANDMEKGKSLDRNKTRTLQCEIGGFCCCTGNHCTRMEPKIMKYARAVLEQKLAVNDAIDMEEINERLRKMEAKLDQIFEVFKSSQK